MNVNYQTPPLLIGTSESAYLVANTQVEGAVAQFATYLLELASSPVIGTSITINGVLVAASDYQNRSGFKLATWPHSFIDWFGQWSGLSANWQATNSDGLVKLTAKKATNLATLTIVNGSPSFLAAIYNTVTGLATNQADEVINPRLETTVTVVTNPAFDLTGLASNAGKQVSGVLTTNFADDGLLKVNLSIMTQFLDQVTPPNLAAISRHPEALIGICLSPAIGFGLAPDVTMQYLATTAETLPSYYLISTSKALLDNQFNLAQCYTGQPNQMPLQLLLPYRIVYPGVPQIEANWIIQNENLAYPAVTVEVLADVTLNNGQQTIILNTLVSENGDPLTNGVYRSCSLAWLYGIDWTRIQELTIKVRTEDNNRNEGFLLSGHLRYRSSMIDTMMSQTIAFANGLGGIETLTFWPTDADDHWITETLPTFYEPLLQSFMLSGWFNHWIDDRLLRADPLSAPEELLWRPVQVQNAQLHYNQLANTIQLVCMVTNL